MIAGIGIIISELFFTGRNWWLVEGREYVEAGRAWDILLTLGLLTVVFNVGMTIRERKKEMSLSHPCPCDGGCRFHTHVRAG